MFSLISRKAMTILLIIAVPIGGCLGWLAIKGRATAPLPEGAVVIPDDLIQMYVTEAGEPFDAFQKDLKTLRERDAKLIATRQKIFFLMLNRAAISSQKASEYEIDFEKRALIKRPQQQQQPPQPQPVIK